jgi:isocitrate/isopropylmalate dehydrogenase
MLMSAILMLRYLDSSDHAERVEKALLAAFRDGIKTPDIGGTAGTKAFTRAVIERLG